MHNILFVDACPRSDSRTRRLAEAVLNRLEGNVTTLDLNSHVPQPLDEAALIRRDTLLEQGELSHPEFDVARQFAAADEIVIAAPFWDLSFPALLKLYLEHICVVGLTFRYTPEGIPQGLCRGQRLHYVTTCGGPFVPDFGFNYVRALAQQFLGIPEVVCVWAENLDLVGADPEAMLQSRIAQL